MATPVLIPVAEYLATAYKPDCDYVDGEVLERNMGEKPHSGLQLLLAIQFDRYRLAWQVAVWLEQRVQVSPTRFRVPDLCLTALAAEQLDSDRIIQIAPLLCIEILSSDQTLRDLRARTDDYLQMGVGAVWVLDPIGRRAWIATTDLPAFTAAEELTVPQQPMQLGVTSLFEEYDRRRAGR